MARGSNAPSIECTCQSPMLHRGLCRFEDGLSAVISELLLGSKICNKNFVESVVCYSYPYLHDGFDGRIESIRLIQCQNENDGHGCGAQQPWRNAAIRKSETGTWLKEIPNWNDSTTLPLFLMEMLVNS